MSTITLEKSSTSAANQPQEPDSALLTFAVADQWFALPAENVQAVLEADCLEVLSGPAEELLGCIVVRGRKVLVRDMSTTLVQGSTPAPAKQIILLRGSKSWAGLTAAGTAEMLNIAKDHLELKPTLDNSSKTVMGTCQVQGRSVTVLNAEALVESIGLAGNPQDKPGGPYHI